MRPTHFHVMVDSYYRGRIAFLLKEHAERFSDILGHSLSVSYTQVQPCVFSCDARFYDDLVMRGCHGCGAQAFGARDRKIFCEICGEEPR